MADSEPTIYSLNGGEVSLDTIARIDQPFYVSACKRLFNAIARITGGAEGRPGTRFVAAGKVESDFIALIDFEPSTDFTYMIEAGDLYFRFFRNKAPVLDGGPVEVTTPYIAADVRELHWAQSIDTLYLAHTIYKPRTLIRVSEISWTLAVIKFIDGPYFDENPDDTKTLTLTGAGPWTKGDSTSMTAAGHTPFLAGHVGSIWRLQAAGGVFTWVTVTAFTSSSDVTVTFETDIDVALQATATASWREGLWSDVHGYPATVTFHEERLIFGGAPGESWSFEASASGLFLTHTPDTGAGDAIRKVLAGNGANAIRWLLSGEYLYAGTSKSVMRIGPRDQETPLSPGNTPYKRIDGEAASPARALLAGGHAVYVGRHKESLHIFPNVVAERGELADDISALARHISERGIEQIVWQADPRKIIWGRLADGGFFAVTFSPRHGVTAWAPQAIGGVDAEVESIGEMPGAHHDEVWMVAKRTIDGATHRYIEVLEDFPHDDTPAEDLWYVDSGVTYTGVATTTIPVPHLEGELVNVWSEGGPRDPVMVAGGVAELTKATTRAQVGLGFSSEISPMPIQPVQPGGERPLAKTKRISKLAVQLHRSIGFKMGRDADHLSNVSLDKHPLFGIAPGLFTGAIEESFTGDWNKAADVLIVQEQSGPLIVLGLVPSVEVGDD